MSSKYWIKLFIEILDDPKMGRMSDTLWRRTIEIFLLAGDNCNNGTLPEMGEMVWRLRLSEDVILETLNKLQTMGIVQQDGDGWNVVNFVKRQTSESLERVRRFRNKHKDSYSNADVTDDVTSPSSSSSLILNSLSSTNDPDAIPMGEPESDEPSLFRQLSTTFETSSGILMHAPEKWIKAITELEKMGAMPDDVNTCIAELREKKYDIVGPWSILNGVRIQIGKRNGTANKKNLEGYTYVGR